jgi:multisubunit Na+/H+ antiporter MnhG subunit
MWVIVMLILIPLVIWFIFETGMPLVIILIFSIFAFPLLVLLNSIMRKWVSDGSYDVNLHERQIEQKQKEHRTTQVKAQEKYDNDWGYIR